ncbi:MAG: 2-keto-4-pentenoate hydratase [Gammaproteobacteria bacterium]
MFLFALLLGAGPACPAGDVAGLLGDADRRDEPLPLASQLQPGLDVTAAYRIQSRFVLEKLRGARVAGFKAGLTSRAAQQRFGLDRPFAGVLYPGGALPGGRAVDTRRFPGLTLEIEIGYVVDRDITAPVHDIAALRPLIRAVVPAIELPRIRFRTPQALTGVDIVAANGGSALFVTGDPLPADALDRVDDLTVTLSRDGTPVAQGRGDAALGNQMHALRWLINQTLKLGWAIEAGQLFITGALAAPLPVEPGAWRADYGGLGSIDLLLL